MPFIQGGAITALPNYSLLNIQEERGSYEIALSFGD
jgi:hypothetical protein